MTKVGSAFRGGNAIRCMTLFATLTPMFAGAAGTQPTLPSRHAGTVFAALTPIFAGAVGAQQPVPTSHASTVCKSARSASARLICSDPDLAAVNSLLTITFHNIQNAASTDDQALLATEQLTWVQGQNQKCGLAGKDYAPLGELRSAKQCLETEIEARISDLQNGSPTGSISSALSAPSAQNVIAADVAQPAVSSDSPKPGTVCKSVKGASARLICADPDLAAADSILSTAFHDAENAASPNDQKLLAREQRTWIQERNQKCGLIGKDRASLAELQSAKQCMEDETKARISDLQNGSPTGSISSALSAPSAQNVIAADVAQPAVSSDSPKPGTVCKSVKGASARLICADPDLAAADSILSTAFHDAENAASPNDQKLLAREQRTWIQERNQKCGLIGKDRASLAELQSAKQCMEDETKARISDLQNGSPTGSVSTAPSAPPAPSGQNVIVTPVTQPADSASSPGSGLGEFPTFQQLHFSAPTEGIDGIIDCSAPPSRQLSDPLANTPFSGKWIVRIAINNNENSYRMFEADTWAAFLDNLRVAVRTACTSALKSGRLRSAANEPISELNDVFEVYSPQGLFAAYSIGQNNPWALQTNQPKARKVVKSGLGIQTWLDPSQLARNPYFFKGSVVGMVIQFDHMLSDNEAVFERPGAEIFVSGVSPNLFQNKELVVLAGRVTGNKGLVSPMGSEALLPALDYVGAYKCGNGCDGF